jgi:hypothetical protein
LSCAVSGSRWVHNSWAQGLFIFDNVPSHQKCAPDAISARHMVKGASAFSVLYSCPIVLTYLTEPKNGWTHHANGPHMRNSALPNGEAQHFYFTEDHPSMPGWFKDMEVIIQEHGLWPKGDSDLLAQCLGFHCPPGCTDCCCQCILFLQPDFVS